LRLAAIVLGGPFLAFAALALVPALRRSGRPAGYVSIAAIATSLAASLALLARFAAGPVPAAWELLWAPVWEAPAIRFGILLDGLSVGMLALVSLVAFLVQVYSLGYMGAESPGSLGRYFAYHSLFAAAMLGLVASPGTLQTYVFWELVGLGSYLLIGFWYHKPEAARAAMKAFWTTRLGDVGFALGVILLASAGGTFAFAELFDKADSGALAGTFLTLGVAGLFLGAMGKSAQFPLHIWLPDAMEGPSPVSALIHAATMVAAGVYLMARISPLLGHVPEVAGLVLAIGALTAFLAATMALVARDVKRILAFSTVSQLGAMMAAVGAAGAGASLFHLTTHAFFKALLFLAAGSVIHTLHTNDIFDMGGVWRRMPLTGACFLVGALALAGVFPLSGFFSKDEILAHLWAEGHPLAFWTLVVTAALTAFYMFRAFFVVFFGRGEAVPGAREAPWVMLAPMAVLAALAVAGGVLGEPIRRLLEHSISAAPGALGGAAVAPAFVPWLGLAAAAAGVGLAWLGYQARVYRPEAVRDAMRPVATLLERRYYVDDAFGIGYRLGYIGLGRLVGWLDRYFVDGLVNFATWLAYGLAGRLRRIQSGRAQDALYAIAIGFLVLAVLALRH
jgi:NADH-quinone oxidoreductase subunit L